MIFLLEDVGRFKRSTRDPFRQRNVGNLAAFDKLLSCSGA